MRNDTQDQVNKRVTENFAVLATQHMLPKAGVEPLGCNKCMTNVKETNPSRFLKVCLLGFCFKLSQ